MQVSNTKRKLPISKDKVKAVLDIMDVAHAFSGQVNTRPRQPLILCPFHDDKHLGSCRVYTDTNTFYCESCQTSGDALKLASVMSRVMRKIDFGIWQKSITGGGLTALWLLFSRQGAKGQGRRYAARLALDAL